MTNEPNDPESLPTLEEQEEAGPNLIQQMRKIDKDETE